MTAPDAPQPDTGAREVYRRMLDTLDALGQFITGPAAPDEQVKAWPLFTGAEYGGVYCAEPNCGCEATGSEIVAGSWAHYGEEGYSTFTLAEVHRLVGEHIGRRAAKREEETNG